MITRRGAMAVVLSPDRSLVLLLRREIFVLWDLPGGGIELNEDPLVAAVRETEEETGIEIEIDRFVGCYLHQSVYGPGDQRTYAFSGHATGGREKRFGLETTGLRWFAVNRLPRGLEALHKQIIADALAGAPGPVERRIDFPLWKLYPARVVFFIVRWENEVLRRLLNIIRRRHG